MVPNQDDAINGLKGVIRDQNAVLFVGSGVAAAMVTKKQRSMATWRGLMGHALDHLRTNAPAIPASVLHDLRQRIASVDPLTFLHAVNEIVDRLHKSHQLETWLKQSVGSLRVQDPRVGDALRNLGLPIVTTNYDDLLEQVTTYGRISWHHTIAVNQFLSPDEPTRIMHLHGIWEDPSSVILDISRYSAIVGDPGTQEVLAPLLDRRWVFVGFGEGLHDPHFAHLLSRYEMHFNEPPYVLLSSASFTERASALRDHSLIPINYGDHAQLWSFLHGLRCQATRSFTAPPDPLTWPELERELSRDIKESAKNMRLMSRTGMGWARDFPSAFDRRRSQMLFLDPAGETFHWDTRYQYVPKALSRGPARDTTIDGRATEAMRHLRELRERDVDVRVVDAPLPSVFWLLDLDASRVLYLEIPRQRASYRGNLYLRTETPVDAADPIISSYEAIFDHWFKGAKPLPDRAD